MDDETLLKLNLKGFIPGPFEKEEDFLKRVEKTEEQTKLFRSDWDWSREMVFDLFDFLPDSLPVFISNKGLRFWEAGACWIENGVPLLQIRKNSIRKIPTEELLAHEAVHAARCGFDESEFEEFFAFASAEKRWRRIFGPLIRRNWEVWLFFAACLLSFTFLGFWPLLILSLAALIRLYKSQRKLKYAALFLSTKILSEKKVRSILFRMTDDEINRLAQGIWVEGDNTLRWRLLHLAYFS